jgi:DNA-binding SARP family transcriptional activator
VTGLHLQIMGPLRVWRDDVEIDLGPRQQRCLLAVLLARAGHPVSMSDLIASIWGFTAPPSAVNVIHKYVGALRRLLEPELALRTPGSYLLRTAGGYRLAAGPETLDLAAFRDLAAAGRAAADRAAADLAATDLAGADLASAGRTGAGADLAATDLAGAGADLADTGRTGAGEALEYFAAALRLCRGPAGESLADSVGAAATFAAIDSEFFDTAIAAADVAVRLRRPAPVLAPLRLAAAMGPLNELVHARLITLLALAGHPAEALATYRAIRERLADDLGIDPGHTLDEAHRRVLTGDRPSGLEIPHLVRPAQLPPDLPSFAGRVAETAALDTLVGQPGRTAPLIVALDGMGGVGKSTLAVHVAHRHAARFTDGQLYLNLRGDLDDDENLLAGDALAALLYALGVPAAQIPGTFDTRVGAYRSLTAGRRILVLLDNVHDPAQVRPLLPNSAASLVLLTSRRPLVGLAAFDGAHLLRIEVPDLASAQELLRRRLSGSPAGHRRDLLLHRTTEQAQGLLSNHPAGPLPHHPTGQARGPLPHHFTAQGRDHLPTGGATGQQAVVDEIIELCGRLPLALAILAARLTARPTLSLESVAADLRDSGRRLEVFPAGTGAPDPRTAFAWSYRQLSDGAARLFRLLSVGLNAGITAAACAGLSGVDPAQTRAELEELVQAALIDEHDDGRLTFHVLVKAYAEELLRDVDGPAERRAAVGRLLQHYLHSSRNAQAMLSPDPTPATAEPVTPEAVATEAGALETGTAEAGAAGVGAAGVRAKWPVTGEQAAAWFAGHRPELIEAVRLAVDIGDLATARLLAESMRPYLESAGHLDDWQDLVRYVRVSLQSRPNAATGSSTAPSA